MCKRAVLIALLFEIGETLDLDHGFFGLASDLDE